MPYITLENFKFGLDARRSELTSQPGTLAILDNAHVNQGAEIEKRKAWVKMVGSPINPVAQGMGLEVSVDALPDYFFQFGNSVTGPITGIDLDWSIGTNTIDSIVASTNFGGKTFCLAHVTPANKVIAFLESDAVEESYVGYVWPGAANAGEVAIQINTALEKLVNNIFNYTVVLNPGGLLPHVIDVYAPAPQSFTLTSATDSAAGTIDVQVVNPVGVKQTPAASAQTTLSISPGATSGTFDSIKVPDGVGGQIELLSPTPVHWLHDNVSTAIALAKNINEHITTPKYTAIQQSNSVVIQAPPGSVYNGANNVTVLYNMAGGDMIINAGASTLIVTQDTHAMAGVNFVPLTTRGLYYAAYVYTQAIGGNTIQLNNPQNTGLGWVTITVQGGTGPYKFNWVIVTNPQPFTNSGLVPVPTVGPPFQNVPTIQNIISGIQITHLDNPGVTIGTSAAYFFCAVEYGFPVTGYAFCEITDNSSPTPNTAQSDVIQLAFTIDLGTQP